MDHLKPNSSTPSISFEAPRQLRAGQMIDCTLSPAEFDAAMMAYCASRGLSEELSLDELNDSRMKSDEII